MTIEELIFTRLSGFAGLAALVSTRIYLGVLPQNAAMPAVSWRRVTDATPQPQQLAGQPDLIRARFQFDCWATTYASARNVRDQVRLALKRWSDIGPPVVQVAFAISAIDLYEDDTELHHLIADYEINYEE